jgi:hypothetical protein
MILESKPLSRQPGPLPGATTATPAVLVPTWLRRAASDAQSPAGKETQEIAIVTGAAISALDAVVRRQERWAGGCGKRFLRPR